MPKDPPGNPGGPGETEGSFARVSGMQTKLHRWAAADPGRRFDDLFNLVCDPATLIVAFERVAGNRGSRTAGVDGMRAADVEQFVGVPGFLDQVRGALKDGSFRPLPVRQRMIPKPGGSGRVRSLGIPTFTDRVVQAALKLVLEPIFEADFLPVSYGFRPRRRAMDAVAEIHLFGTKSYRWVLDADIEACFDQIDHTALMDRVRLRVKDKRVLALVKAFLKAGAMSTSGRRRYRRERGLPNWRVVRYADDFVVLVNGTQADVEALREDLADVLGAIGLRLSPAKTQIVHMSEGFDFLGFHIQWRRKRGSHRWHVYTFVGDRPIRSLKAKVRALTPRTSQLEPRAVLIRLAQIMRGWSAYFRHAVAKNTFRRLAHFVWNRVVRWLRTLHRWTWTDFRRRFTTPTGRWEPLSADGVELFDLATVPITRYRYRGAAIPSPWRLPQPA